MRVPVWVRAALFIAIVPATVAGWLPWYTAGAPPLAPHAGATLTAIALVLMIAGWGVLLVCAREFARAGRGTPAPYDPPRALVTSGMYRFTRNPMYVGVVTAIFGQALWLRSRDAAIYGVVVALMFQIAIVLYEEPRLTKVFGEEYLEYKKSVPRWVGFRRAGGANGRAELSR
jgi:protein-S-isoprenylcysteine O-methyltransferase Ste14